MKKLQLTAAVFVGVLAFGAFMAVTASAAFLLAEWLLNGVAIAANDSVEIFLELLLEDKAMLAPAKPDVLCSEILDGWVGPSSLGFISEVLNVNDELISSVQLSGLALLCALDARSLCEASTETVDVYPVGLPWEIEVELLEQTGGPFFIVLLTKLGGGILGWEAANCLVFGVPQDDECTNEVEALALKLEGITLLASFSEEITHLAGLKLGHCSQSGTEAETGLTEGGGSFIVGGGGELAASSEGVDS